jgi:hypothetical protein
MDLFGLVGTKITLSIPLSKTGGPTTGSVALLEDFTDPRDCVSGSVTTGPLTFTPLAQSHDEDLDGCADWEELGTVQTAGGLRDPFNYWDFFDVPVGTWPALTRDKAVSSLDTFAILARYGSSGDPNIDPLSAPAAPPAYHPAYDRSATLGPNVWNLNKADGAITGTDTFAVLGQFGHDCSAAP